MKLQRQQENPCIPQSQWISHVSGSCIDLTKARLRSLSLDVNHTRSSGLDPGLVLNSVVRHRPKQKKHLLQTMLLKILTNVKALQNIANDFVAIRRFFV